MSLYEIAILGSPTPDERQALSVTLSELIADFGLTVGGDVAVRDASTIAGVVPGVAFACAYFAGDPAVDQAVVEALMAKSLPVIPTTSPGQLFGHTVPPILQPMNGLIRRDDDPGHVELATALLECNGLLRKQRRVFVSYRRTESRLVALQIHDLLLSRGFDVFLDTHDIRPGEPFQDVLWHRLCDSDVMVMLDTPTYFESRWTRAEIGRARAKEIQVLRVIWPGCTPTKLTDMSETIYLTQDDLLGADGPLIDGLADQIALKVESLRSRSIAARYMSITGRLRADIERSGAKIEGIGAHRAIAIRLLNDKRLWAYPIVGIPTAELLHDAAEKAKRAQQDGHPILVYDHVGIGAQWNAHLGWLDAEIKAIRAIRVSEAGWILSDWAN